MKEITVLIVEDDRDIAAMVAYNLRREGFLIRETTTGEAALKSAAAMPPDLILLDLMLPGINGLDVTRTLKDDPKTKHIPIIMVTALGEEEDIVTGLELGADDYVTKPFRPKVLTARVRSVLRRKRETPTTEFEPIRIGALTVEPGKHEAYLDDEPLHLSQTEFRILHFLTRRPGWVFTRYQIVDGVHDGDRDVTDRSIDVQIFGLRKKLGEHGDLIETVRGVGYRFRDA